MYQLTNLFVGVLYMCVCAPFVTTLENIETNVHKVNAEFT
jgi:hypothetical protein